MICNFCGKEFEHESQVVEMFDSRFCLHDGKLKHYRAVGGLGLKNDTLSVKVAKSGRNRTEQKYIEKEKREGNVVIRGSDGILRSVGAD